MKKYVIIIIFLNSINMTGQTILDIQGHRGCRGLYPENSLIAFIHAMKLGVTTLEFDVVISKNKDIIVSHEPFMNHEISKQPNGDLILKDDEEKHNIYTLTYDQIKLYDTGTKYFEKFPHQVKIKCHKPRLEDVIIESTKLNPNILYNIEIKRKKKWDKIHHPPFQEFADIVISKLEELKVLDRTTVQCFDVETLQYLHKKYPNVKLVYLIYNENTLTENMKILGFTPHIYSPYFKLIKKEDVSYCRTNAIKLIPWTVNNFEDIRHQIDLGVDGIITDYPDRLIQILKSQKK